jgi:hypothetical protein
MGIGIILATLVMTTVQINHELSDAEIEKRARKLGMKYENEMKVIFSDEGVK